MGRLADAHLRQAKLKAHEAFDPIWKGRKMSRSKAYGWLAKQLGISREETHIGMFDLETCRLVIEICREAVR